MADNLIVADRLSLSVFCAIIFMFMCGHRNLRCLIADYMETDFTIRLLSRFIDIKVIPHDLGDFVNDNGIHAFLDREDILASIDKQMADLFLNAMSGTLPPAAQSVEDLRRFVSRYIVYCYANRVSAALLCAYFVIQKKVQVKKIFIQEGFLPESISKKLPFCNFYKSWDFFKSDLIQIIRLIFHRLRCFTNVKSSISDEVLKKLGVQYNGGFINNGFGTDFDFLPYSGLDYKDMVYVIQNNQIPDPIKLDDYKSNGLRVYNSQDFKFLYSDQFVQEDLSLAYRAMFKAFCSCDGGVFAKVKAAAIIGFYGYCTAKWRYIFRSNGIVAYVTVADTNPDALPQMNALESLGGVDLSYEFSATGYHSYMDAKPLGRHQYICWGNLSSDMILECDSKTPYRLAPREIFYAGNIKMFLQGMRLEFHKDIIKSIENNSKKTKVLIIDSATTHLKFLSILELQYYYDALLELIGKKPNCFYIIKSQRNPILRQDQMAALQAFESEGRLAYAPEAGLLHYMLPLVDLVIGMPIYSSAVIESAAARKRVLCFNTMKWPHKLENYIPREALVNNAKTLIESFDAALAGAINYDAFFDAIDPYGDLNGMQRFGFYIGLWLESIRVHGSADLALDFVKRSYYNKWPLPKTYAVRKVS